MAFHVRLLAYVCNIVGSAFTLWTLSCILGWWFLPSWHATREPLISAFFLLVPVIPCAVLVFALAVANRRNWPRHLLIASWLLATIGAFTILLWWFTDGSAT